MDKDNILFTCFIGMTSLFFLLALSMPRKTEIVLDNTQVEVSKDTVTLHYGGEVYKKPRGQ